MLIQGIFLRTLTKCPCTSPDQELMAGTAPTWCHHHTILCATGYYPSGNYHIHGGRGSGLMEAFRVTRSGGSDLMILMDTKIKDKAYRQRNMVYNMVCS